MKNKLRIFITVSLAFAGSIVYAQDSEPVKNMAHSFIGIAGGVASPIGSFGSSDYTDEFAGNDHNNGLGFAKAGSHFALEGAYYFTPNIGIGGVFSSSSFSVDVTAVANAYLEAFDCDSATAVAMNYKTTSFLVGPYFALPFHKLTIEARILGGVTNTTSPDFIVQAINEPDPTDPISISKFVQTSGSAAAFGFQAGLGIKYAVMEYWSIGIRGDYFYSKPNLTFDNVGRQNATGREIYSYNQPIAGFTGTIGIAYLFGK